MNFEDTISFLKLFNIFLFKFKVCIDPKAMNYIKIMFFNKFLIEIIQEDLINCIKLKALFGFLIDFTNQVDDKDFSDLLFKFLFGFEQQGDITDHLYLENNQDLPSDNPYDISDSTFNSEKSSVLITNSLTCGDRIDRKLHYTEEIIPIISKILDNSTVVELKVKLIIICTNLIKRSYNLFLKEIINPFYCNAIFNIDKNNFENKLVEYQKPQLKVVSNVEVIKSIISPKNFRLVSELIQERKYTLEGENFICKNYLKVVIHQFQKGFLSCTSNNCSLLSIFRVESGEEIAKEKDKKKGNKEQQPNKNKQITKELFTDVLQNIRARLEFNFFKKIRFFEIRFFEILIKYLLNFLYNSPKENMVLTSLFNCIFNIPINKSISVNDINLYDNFNLFKVKETQLFSFSSIG